MAKRAIPRHVPVMKLAWCVTVGVAVSMGIACAMRALKVTPAKILPAKDIHVAHPEMSAMEKGCVTMASVCA